jgi:hypothetical protein
MGATFSVINVNPKFTHRIVESIKLQGLASRQVSVEQMKLDRPGVFDLALRDDAAKAEIVGQFADCARRSIEKGVSIPKEPAIFKIFSASMIASPSFNVMS